MFVKAAIVWVIGLVTVVPYGIYYLFFEASKDQYAWLITLLLFWILGYWSLIGPLLMGLKVRSVFRAIESARSREDIERMLKDPEAKAVVVDFIARENRIPRFLASRVYSLLVTHLSEGAGERG